jgi:hypothetical protein
MPDRIDDFSNDTPLLPDPLIYEKEQPPAW